MDYKIRQMYKSEYPLLDDFCYEAIYIPEGAAAPPRSIIQQPSLQVYIAEFGEHIDDFAMAAETERKVIGAVWARIMNDYGHIDDETPSLAIALHKEYRSKGIGTDLMCEMLTLLKKHGYKSVSLSVQKENYALKMYEKLGFVKVKDGGEGELIMRCRLI